MLTPEELQALTFRERLALVERLHALNAQDYAVALSKAAGSTVHVKLTTRIDVQIVSGISGPPPGYQGWGIHDG